MHIFIDIQMHFGYSHRGACRKLAPQRYVSLALGPGRVKLAMPNPHPWCRQRKWTKRFLRSCKSPWLHIKSILGHHCGHDFRFDACQNILFGSRFWPIQDTLVHIKHYTIRFMGHSKWIISTIIFWFKNSSDWNECNMVYFTFSSYVVQSIFSVKNTYFIFKLNTNLFYLWFFVTLWPSKHENM